MWSLISWVAFPGFYSSPNFVPFSPSFATNRSYSTNLLFLSPSSSTPLSSFMSFWPSPFPYTHNDHPILILVEDRINKKELLWGQMTTISSSPRCTNDCFEIKSRKIIHPMFMANQIIYGKAFFKSKIFEDSLFDLVPMSRRFGKLVENWLNFQRKLQQSPSWWPDLFSNTFQLLFDPFFRKLIQLIDRFCSWSFCDIFVAPFSNWPF